MKKTNEGTVKHMPDTAFGELKVLQRLNEYEFGFEADILRDGPVQGGRWVFENLAENYKSFAGRPVLVAYIGKRVGDGHNSREVRDPKTGEVYRSFIDPTAERIVGTISEDESDLSLVEQDGYTWVRVKGRLFAEYCRELIETIERTGRMAVSIEANVYDVRDVGGVEHYDRWTALGLTILHPDTAPAVPGANIRALSDMEEEFESMKLRVASLVKESESRKGKPQTDSTEKELKKSMRFSKAKLAELQEKVGSEYKVLSAEQEGSDIRVRLMRKSDRTFYAYDMTDSDETVLPERFVARAAYIGMEAAEDDEDAYCAEAGDVIGEECAEAEAERDRACSERDAMAAELAECKAQLAAMREFEAKRRVSAAKEHALAILNSYNANRSEKVSQSVIASVVADAESGAYSDRMDKEGNWIGLSAVEKDVKALCADEQMKLDAKKAQNERTQFVWSRYASAGNQPDDGSPAALLASL